MNEALWTPESITAASNLAAQFGTTVWNVIGQVEDWYSGAPISPELLQMMDASPEVAGPIATQYTAVTGNDIRWTPGNDKGGGGGGWYIQPIEPAPAPVPNEKDRDPIQEEPVSPISAPGGQIAITTPELMNPSFMQFLQQYGSQFGPTGPNELQNSLQAWINGAAPSQLLSTVLQDPNVSGMLNQIYTNAVGPAPTPAPAPTGTYSDGKDKPDDYYGPEPYTGPYTGPQYPTGGDQKDDDRSGMPPPGPPPPGYIDPDWVPRPGQGPAPIPSSTQTTTLPSGEVVPYYPEIGQLPGTPPPGWQGPQTVTNTPPASTNPYGSNNVQFNYQAPPQWWQQGAGLSQGVNPTDWVAQRTINQALPYLDPWTQRSAQQWLYRDNPRGYNEYQNVEHAGGTVPWQAPPAPATPPAPSTPEPNGPDPRPPMYNAGDPFALGGVSPLNEDERMGYIAGDRIRNVADQLTYQNLLSNMDDATKQWLAGQKELSLANLGEIKDQKLKQSQGIQTSNTAKSALGWLQEALHTAERAAPGATRAQQTLSMEHLDTLFKEAAQDPGMSSYQTLFENLVNPVTWDQPLSGVLGTTRSVRKRKDDYKRGGLSFRNMSAL